MTVNVAPSRSLCPMESLEGVDPFDPLILSKPESFWAKLRKDNPVYEVALPGAESRVFFITRRADIEEICRHPEKFSSRALPSVFRWPDQPPEFDCVFKGQTFASTFVTADPPEHSAYRRVADSGLAPNKIRKWHDTISAIVQRLAAALPSNQPFDFVEKYSVLLPSETIRTILGLPEEDAQFLVWFTDEFMAMVDPSTAIDVAIQRAEGVKRAQEYLLPKIEAYREQAADNFFSQIANARRESGELMSIEEVLSMIFITIIGGNETTRNGITSTVFYLATKPDIWASLQADRSRIPNFVHEALRLATPANFLPRTVRVDTTMHGVHLPKGSTLFLIWASGNRDETTFKNPDELILNRSNARSHLAFGMGPHYCAGNHLARLEISLTVERLLSDFSAIELAVPFNQIDYEPIFSVRTLRTLPLRLSRYA